MGWSGPELAARLRRLAADQTVRAIVLLDTPGEGRAAPRRARGGRQRAIETVRKPAEPALSEVDRILECTGGTRLAPRVDALGAVPVEVTPAGAQALAASGHVKAILEDQPISVLPTS